MFGFDLVLSTTINGMAGMPVAVVTGSREDGVTVRWCNLDEENCFWSRLQGLCDMKAAIQPQAVRVSIAVVSYAGQIAG